MPTGPLASRQPAAGCTTAGVTARAWENSVKAADGVPKPWRRQVAAGEPISLQAIWRFPGNFSQSAALRGRAPSPAPLSMTARRSISPSDKCSSASRSVLSRTMLPAVAIGSPVNAIHLHDRRSSRRRFRYQPCAAGRQRHRFHGCRIQLSGKFLELLKEVAPGVTRTAPAGRQSNAISRE